MSRNGSLKRINKKLKKYYGYSYTDLLDVMNDITIKISVCVHQLNETVGDRVKLCSKTVDERQVILADNLSLCINCLKDIDEPLLDVSKSIRDSYFK